MPSIIVSTEVQRSAKDVFAYATDPTRFSEWQKGVVDGHTEEPSIPSVGTRCMTVRRIGFAERPSTSELVHIDPPRTWQILGIYGPIRAMVDVAVAPLTDNSARLTIAIDFEGRGIGRLLVPLSSAGRLARRCRPTSRLSSSAWNPRRRTPGWAEATVALRLPG
jgi:hypothetical protein